MIFFLRKSILNVLYSKRLVRFFYVSLSLFTENIIMKNNSNILIIGASNGLGRFLAEKLENCYVLNRDSKIENLKYKRFDIIINCANNPSSDISLHNLNQFIYDNFYINQLILNLRFDHLIFISSIGVYPYKDKDKDWKENDDFVIKTRNYYEFLKLMSERFFFSKIKNITVLRSSGLLGLGMRENSITKIIHNKKIKLKLSSKSLFNYILYQDIYSFIQIVIEKKKFGIFNVCASKNLSLLEIKKKYNSFNISFGKYDYIIPTINNSLAASELNILRNTTEQNIHRYFKLKN